MSITHTFTMKSVLATDEVMDLLCENLPFIEDVDKNWKSLTTTNEAMSFNVVDGRLGPELIEKVFGFTPDLNLLFSMRKDAERYNTGKSQLLSISSWLLENLPGDALLMFGDNIAMRRKDGRVYLLNNAREVGNWRDVDLANFTVPYEWAELPETF